MKAGRLAVGPKPRRDDATSEDDGYQLGPSSRSDGLGAAVLAVAAVVFGLCGSISFARVAAVGIRLGFARAAVLFGRHVTVAFIAAIGVGGLVAFTVIALARLARRLRNAAAVVRGLTTVALVGSASAVIAAVALNRCRVTAVAGRLNSTTRDREGGQEAKVQEERVVHCCSIT